MLDNLTMHRFTDNVHARLNRADGHVQPDRFLIATRLARACKAPQPQFSTEPRTQSVRTRVG